MLKLKKLFFIYDKEDESNLKKKIMFKSGIPQEAISFKEVYIHGNKNEYIHTIIIDDNQFENKRDLVFIHGLTCSGVCYYGILRELRTKFRIYAMDLPGMGCSSRNELSLNSYKDAETYFIERIKFAIDYFKLTNFTLIGHSIGGYISSLFSTKYSHMIDNLILLSPVGLSSRYIKIVFDSPFEDIVKRLFYQGGHPPSLGFKIFNIYSSFVLDKILDTNFKESWMSKDKENFKAFKDFMFLLMANFCFSERAMFYMFDSDFRAYMPITQNYNKIEKLNILVFYGDHDWSPKEHAEDLKMLIPSLEIEVLENSSHVLYCDNSYIKMCEKILKFCEEKLEKRNEYIENSDNTACNIIENENLPKNLDNLNC